MKYLPTIGLEIHAELKTKSKMFCSCKNDPFVKEPNIYVCPVCFGLPGALPVMNKQAVIDTILIGRALNGTIAPFTKWDRKHYFYPDLPKGYQISQYDIPLVTGGLLEINNQKINLTRIHLEEDTGKLLHASSGESLVDYNRSGVPLVELVTEPDIADAKTARLFAEEYQLILRTLGVATADMEKGEMRVEVNISIAEPGKRGTKVEIKNLNSFKSVEQSIVYEIKRQTELLENGESVVQETRGFDGEKQITISQRKKETAADYRYFPEPDLPPVDTTILEIPVLPLLPGDLRVKFKEAGIKEADSELLISRPELRSIIELVAESSPEHIVTIAKLLVNYPKARETETKILLELAVKTPHQVKEYFKTGSLVQDELGKGEIELKIKEIIANNPAAVEDYANGKKAAFGFIIGQAMREFQGKVDPAIVTKIVTALLNAK